MKRCGILLAGTVFAGAAIYSGVLARADWLRNHPTEARVAEAMRLDPGHPYAYTLQAEYLEQAGRFDDAERAWQQALRWNPRDGEAWMRAAVLAEGRGDAGESERRLLEAARVQRTWLPRWALVNFYARHERRDEVWKWARLALERASGDVDGLFGLLESAGAEPGFVMRELLPRNRAVMAAFVARLIQEEAGHRPAAGHSPAPLEEAAGRLVGMIGDVATGWPGAESASGDRKCTDGERWVLQGAVNRLLDDGNGAGAARVWNALLGKRSDEGPVMFDWKGEWGREMRFELDGKQPESVDLAAVRVYLPAGRGYQFSAETRMDVANGVEFALEPRSTQRALRATEDWQQVSMDLPGNGVVTLVLRYRRPLGQVRAAGVVWVRNAETRRL